MATQFDPVPDRISPESQKEYDEFYKQRNHALNTVFIKAIYFVSGVFCLLFSVRVLHFVLPECWHWLKIDQINSIDKFLFSGIAGALVGKHVDEAFRRREK